MLCPTCGRSRDNGPFCSNYFHVAHLLYVKRHWPPMTKEPDMTNTDLIERLKYVVEHGLFKAAKDGKAASYAEAADALTEANAKLVKALKAMESIEPYLKWTIGPEGPGYHPTMPSAVAEFCATLAELEDGQS
jgi:hypothetical protein